MFSEKDIEQIKSRGSDPKTIEEQIKNFEKGFPYLKIYKPATINDGINRFDEHEKNNLIKNFEQEGAKKDLLKFVPASGAATRMFKSLYAFKNQNKDGSEAHQNLQENKEVKRFFNNLDRFAFKNELEKVLKNQTGISINNLIKDYAYVTILNGLLEEEGLGYGQLPKALIKFHKYKDHSRTAMEEHFVEGANYCMSSKQIHLHFTNSPEHRSGFKNHIENIQPFHEKQFNVKYQVELSEQKPHTDTIAVDLNNQPFREEDGSLFFRPGGHGALIENLNSLDADLIFIKNIDNVVPDRLKQETYDHKKLLGGVLLNYQEKIFDYLKLLENNTSLDEGKFEEIQKFLKEDLCIIPPAMVENMPREKLRDYFYQKLNRPLRVCGMVKNEGEPGGGPFWAENSDGTVSLQIVETSQVDMGDPEQEEIVTSSTHFNPVDIVCATKNFKGQKFDLLRYRDPNTGFISEKSKNGKPLKAQELPGLWNGAMADWITIFVEVPIITFNPVKTINDLLRDEHQG